MKTKNVYSTNRSMSRGRLTIQAMADTASIRHETFLGEDHLVVPIVALVEGVIHPSNAEFPELALASEFGRVPDGWNGRPIVFDHPTINDSPVSANIPGVVETEVFGMMFNTKIEDRKLKTEAWINLTRVNNLREEIQDAVTRLESGEVSEVSTGLFVALEEVEGTFNGKDFGGIWREVVPDHLAILPLGITGASSVEDGAGAPRINASRQSYDVIQDDPKPIGIFQTLTDKVREALGFKVQGQSDTDIRNSLEAAIEATTDEYVWIMSVYNEDGYFIYETGLSGKTLKRNFEIDDDGNVTLIGESEVVRPVTEFVPVTTNKENGDMLISAERVAALIANSVNAFTEDDTAYLSNCPEATFAKLEALSTPAEEPAPAPTATVTENAETTEEPAPTANAGAEETPMTVDAYVKQAPDEIRGVLNAGLKLQSQNRERLITGIKANKDNSFSDEQLAVFDVTTLEGLAKLANVTPDYSGQAPIVNSGDNDEIPAPADVFAKSAA